MKVYKMRNKLEKNEIGYCQDEFVCLTYWESKSKSKYQQTPEPTEMEKRKKN